MTEENKFEGPFGGPNDAPAEQDHEAVIASLKAMLKREQERTADAERLDWLERWHTLHRTVEFLYVVDGYEVTMLYDHSPVSAPFYGTTLREAIDKARAVYVSPE